MARGDSIRSIPAARLALWLFLASEIMIFGGLISCFILLRIAHGGWDAEAAHVHWRIGAFNTLVLLTSSLTMALACTGAKEGMTRRVRTCLALTIVLGLTFLGVKAHEYSLEVSEGLDAGSWAFLGVLLHIDRPALITRAGGDHPEHHTLDRRGTDATVVFGTTPD